MEPYIDMPDPDPEFLKDQELLRLGATSPSRPIEIRKRSVSVMTVSSSRSPPRVDLTPDTPPLPPAGLPGHSRRPSTPLEISYQPPASRSGSSDHHGPSPSNGEPSTPVRREVTPVGREASPWSPATPPPPQQRELLETEEVTEPPVLVPASVPSPSPSPPASSSSSSSSSPIQPSPTKSDTPQQQSIFTQQEIEYDQQEMDRMYEKVAALMASQQDVSDGESGDDDEDYETRRAKKLLENHALMVQLGLAAPKPPDRSASSSRGPSPSPAGGSGDQDTADKPSTSSQAPPPPPPKPTRSRPERKLKLAEDGTTTCAPLPGTVHELAYVDLLPLRERAKDDYVYVDNFPIRAPTPPPAPEPVPPPKPDPREAPKKSKTKAGPAKSRPSVSGATKKRTPAQMLAADPALAGATSCHQCRRKTVEPKMHCANVGVTPDGKKRHCPLMFCHSCLVIRYGANHAEQPDEIWDPEKTDWECPKCRGICNCSNCLARANFQPETAAAEGAKRTATLSKVLLIKDGDGKRKYRSVRHYLEAVYGLTSTSEPWSAQAASTSGRIKQEESEGDGDVFANSNGQAADAATAADRDDDSGAGKTPKKPGRLIVRLKRPSGGQDNPSAQAQDGDIAANGASNVNDGHGNAGPPASSKAPQGLGETIDTASESRHRIVELERKNCWVKGPADLIDSDSDSDLTDLDEDMDDLAAAEPTKGSFMQNHLRPYPSAEGGAQLLRL